MLKSITIVQRFWLWAAFATIIFYIACALAWIGLAKSRDSLQKVHDESLVSLLEIVEFRQLLNANRLEMLLALQHAPSSGFAQIHDHPIEMHFDAIEKRAAEIDRLFASIKAKALDEEGKRLFAEFEAKRAAWLAKARELIAAMKGGDMSPALGARVLAAGREEFAAAIEALNRYSHHHKEIAQREYQAAEARFQQTRAVLIALIVIGAIAGTAMGVTAMRRLRHGFAEAQRVAQTVAAGDLTRPIEATRGDEIGRLLAELGKMQAALRQVIGALHDETRRLAAQSAELDQAASNGRKVAGDQSEAASAMAAAVEELSVSIDQVEAHAEEVRRITQEAAQRSRDSAQVIEKATAEIHDIAQAVTGTAADIRNLEERAASISGIVNVIREIADQTNLLALNAAIEAARAGEMGRGFAVVADEVRKLAERTTASTGEITQMIEEIQRGARAAAEGMAASVARVEEGVKLAEEAGNSIAAIEAASSDVTAAVDGIGATLKEQAAAARDIAGRVEHVSQGAEELAASSQQTATAAAELVKVARDLESQAAKFRL